MGVCRGCSEVFPALEMNEGLCKSCLQKEGKEFIEHKVENTNKNDSSLFSFKGRATRGNYITSFFIALGIVIFGVFLSDSLISQNIKTNTVIERGWFSSEKIQKKSIESTSYLGIITLKGNQKIELQILNFLVFSIIANLVTLTATIRRWHDLGYSGWFILIQYVPLANIWGFIMLLFIKGNFYDNAYGKNPYPYTLAVVNEDSTRS